jgi:hypothetical protein
MLNRSKKDIFMHIGATPRRLMEGAEALNLKKLYKNNYFREFYIGDMYNFVGHGKLWFILVDFVCLVKIFL